MKKTKILIAFIILINAFSVNGQIAVTYNINTSQERDTISKYIYGMCNGSYHLATIRRMGGNRLSAYNWENNYSNAGADYYNQNDNYLPWNAGIPSANYTTPGICLKAFHDTSLAQNAISALTLPMVGYVANDGNGVVQSSELAPSSRWSQVINKKGSPFSLTPNTADNIVYVDEEINYLLQIFGNSNSATGVKAYIMDNEPGLWSGQFSSMRSNAVTYSELLTKSLALASTIKGMDSGAWVFGSEGYGFNEYWNLQDASDAGNYSTDHWFIDTYLKTFKHAQDTGMKRFLDVFTIHWYPDGGNIYSDDTTTAVRNDRVQRPRALWDSTYTDPTWIGEWFGTELPIVPHIQNSINTFYPGTKFGITEYDFGAHNDISGGIAQSDVLGMFGRNSVDFATIWGNVEGYIKTAFNLYLNYDGNNSKYGLIKVKAVSNNVAASTIYASTNDNTNNILHCIVNNKNSSTSINASINIQSPVNYNLVDAYFFNKSNNTINHIPLFASVINGNILTYQIPPYSVYHFVLRNSLTSINDNQKNNELINIYPNPTNDKVEIEGLQIETIEIINLQGQTVKTLNISSSKATIDLSLLLNGVYAMKIITDNGIIIRKLIKQ